MHDAWAQDDVGSFRSHFGSGRRCLVRGRPFRMLTWRAPEAARDFHDGYGAWPLAALAEG